MKYTHTNIITKDWKKLANFYIEVFECKIMPPIRNQSGNWLSKGTGVKNAALKGAHLLLPGYGEKGPTLEIYEYAEMVMQAPIVPNQRGFGHLAFEVNNVAEIVKKLKQHGGSTFGEITSRTIEGVGIITFVYARDPDGNLIEVQHWER